MANLCWNGNILVSVWQNNKLVIIATNNFQPIFEESLDRLRIGIEMFVSNLKLSDFSLQAEARYLSDEQQERREELQSMRVKDLKAILSNQH